jgi:hypothetical protein
MTKKIPRTIATFKAPTSSPALIAFAQTVVEGMTGNPHFPAPNPPLAGITGAIAALVAAQSRAATKVKGAAQDRDQKHAELAKLLHQEKDYVQQVADGDPPNAPTIILSARYALRKHPVKTKANFAVTHGEVSGSAKLVAKAAAQRASYEWQYSTDGKTWTTVPATLTAKTTIENLTPGTLYSFRFRAVTKAGEGNWSDVVTLVMI